MKEELFTNFEPYTKLRLNKFLKESKIKSKDNVMQLANAIEEAFEEK